MANTPALGAGIAVQVRHSRPMTSYRWSPYGGWYHLEVARFVISHYAISTKFPLRIYPHWDTMQNRAAVARQPHKLNVVGSNPTSATILRGRAVGSLPDSLSGGRWFESSPRNQYRIRLLAKRIRDLMPRSQ